MCKPLVQGLQTLEVGDHVGVFHNTGHKNQVKI